MNRLLYTFTSMGYLNDSNTEIIHYGLQKIHELLIDITLVILCGLITGNIGSSLIYETAYIPLRIYAGGYHATNKKIANIFLGEALYSVLSLSTICQSEYAFYTSLWQYL